MLLLQFHGLKSCLVCVGLDWVLGDICAGVSAAVLVSMISLRLSLKLGERCLCVNVF